MSDWVLLKDGQEIARHSTDLACCVEAIERRMVWQAEGYVGLLPGAEIKELPARPIRDDGGQ